MQPRHNNLYRRGAKSPEKANETWGTFPKYLLLQGIIMQKKQLFILLILIGTTGLACSETAETWNKKAEQAVSARNYEEAIRCVKKAIDMDPNNQTAYSTLGWSYKAQGRLDEAIGAYKKAIAIKPMFKKEIYCYLGDVYFIQGKIDEAIAEFKKAIAIDPDFAEAHYHLGISYKKQSHNILAGQYLYEAGVLALLQGDKIAALKAYHNLQDMGSHELLQDLGEMIAPWIEEGSKNAEP